LPGDWSDDASGLAGPVAASSVSNNDIHTEWLARPAAQHATDRQASDFACEITARGDGNNRRYQHVMADIRPLIGLP
jgi:hypothetical protein